MSEVLRITDLGQAFGSNDVLSGVTFSLDAGERLAVLGPSGSGKTTLLLLIAGLEPPTRGLIEIAGRIVSRPGELLIAPEKREVALVFQGLALFPHLNALDQIAFAARGHGGKPHAKSLLDRIGLGHRASARLDELSGGERQRIALARALAQEPKLLLMDEPFASLDDEKRAEMRDLLRSLLDRTKTTLILVTHSRDDALDLARRVLVLDRGKPAACDLLENVLVTPRRAAVVRSLGLGQIIEGRLIGKGIAETTFGKIKVNSDLLSGDVQLLIRPAQPRIVQQNAGVEAEVVALELRPPDTREVRRVAVVRIAGHQMRIPVTDSLLSIGDRVHIQIDGPCDVIDS